MRIGMVSFAADSVELAGPDSRVPALAGALCAHGHEVVLLARSQQSQPAPWHLEAPFEVRDLVAGPCSVLSEPAAVGHMGDFVRELGREIDVGDYDVLHSHGWLAGLAVHLTVPAQPRPVVHTFHRLRLMEGSERSGGPDGLVPSATLRAERAVARRADHLIASSVLEREALVRVGVPRRRITVVPPGTDHQNGAGDLTGHETASGDTSAELAPPSRRQRVVVFGPPTKATDVVHALPALPKAELVLCRTPQDPRGDGAEWLTELATTLGVAQRVRIEYLATPTERAPLIRSADVVLCLPSSARAGTGHLEAMVLGVPVVAGSSEAAEAVIDGITGLHALNTSPRSLATLLRDLLANHTLRQGMGAAARDRAVSRYSWERIAAETARVYDHVRGHQSGERLAAAVVPEPRTSALSESLPGNH